MNRAAEPVTRQFASPAARALARDNGLDWVGLQGSGPQGRVLRADVAAALGSADVGARVHTDATDAASAEGAVGAAGAASIGAPYDETPNSFARRLAARRLVESKQRAPHFYARIDCCVDALLRQRNTLRPLAEAQQCKLSLNDFILVAAAQALAEVPAVNASYTDAAIRRYREIHIAVAVAVADGVLMPVLTNVDQKSVLQIAAAMAGLVQQARAGTLPPGASSGGTFSVSNLGGFGVREFAAVINPPQGAILAVGAAEPRAVVNDGQLAVATMMTVTLSADHRVIDGADAARWLAAFKRHVEQPAELAV